MKNNRPNQLLVTHKKKEEKSTHAQVQETVAVNQSFNLASSAKDKRIWNRTHHIQNLPPQSALISTAVSQSFAQEKKYVYIAHREKNTFKPKASK